MPNTDGLQPMVFRPATPRNLEDLFRHVHKASFEEEGLELTGNKHVESHLRRCSGEQVDPQMDLAVGREVMVVGDGVEVELSQLDMASGFQRPVICQHAAPAWLGIGSLT